jgi:hypothetical protein
VKRSSKTPSKSSARTASPWSAPGEHAPPKQQTGGRWPAPPKHQKQKKSDRTSDDHQKDPNRVRGGDTRVRNQHARNAQVPGFLVDVANLVWRERLPMVDVAAGEHDEAALAAAVRRLAPHDADLDRALAEWGVPHTVSAAPLTRRPFLIAGIYAADVLAERACDPAEPWPRIGTWPRIPPFYGMPLVEHARISLLRGWGSVGVALFADVVDHAEAVDALAAWMKNCDAAAGWLELLRTLPDSGVFPVRCCEATGCARPLFFYAGGTRTTRCLRCRPPNKHGLARRSPRANSSVKQNLSRPSLTRSRNSMR